MGLTKMMVPNSKIDGVTLKKMMLSAASNLEQTKEHLNAINVFPIPDGDTGVNLFLTMRTVIEQFDGVDSASIAEVAQLITKGSFLGAKGNSGVIISQFFQGFSAEIEEHDEVGIEDFVKALEAGCEWAYDAVLHPTEGTILTVIKDTAAVAKTVAEKGGDWKEMISETYSTAVVSLENTPNLLPVLKEAGVVDAGAMGFVNVWLGWCFQLMDSLGIKIAHIEEEFEKLQNGD
ncbi:MAG: DAK2 domain-containing protein [Candidatus Heimdallarchaeaceae archaeon]|jgi:dihydroxyacetone kinase-like predicted kinase